MTERVLFMGHVVLPDCIRVDKGKVKAIRELNEYEFYSYCCGHVLEKWLILFHAVGSLMNAMLLTSNLRR